MRYAVKIILKMLLFDRLERGRYTLQGNGIMLEAPVYNTPDD